MTAAVVYARYSSHGQTEQSIEGQLAAARKYAAAKGYTIILAIPLSRLGIRELDLEAVQGKTIPFDAVFFNGEYKETRYYEGPSKGEKPAGVITLTTPETLAQK